MSKVFRPFWSYDVEKTEEWLSAMAEKGLFLVKLNRWKRIFLFSKGVPKKITYRINYVKIRGESLSKSLLDGGWEKVLHCGKWQVCSNGNTIEQVKTFPVREGVIKHNRKIMYIFYSVLIYLSWIAFFNIALISYSFFQNVPINVVESPLWILTYTFIGIAIIIFMLAAYSVGKIKKTNKHLINKEQYKPHVGNNIGGRLSKEKEKSLKFSGQLVVKRKFGWMYAPDRLEKWLVTMEEQGLNLYRVSKTGTAFYFIKGSPRRISYCVDYQNISSESYFDFFRSAGWMSVFISLSSLQKWTIWSREYSEIEEQPQIYSDKTNHLKHARRIATAYSLLFLPMIIMSMLNLGIVIEEISNSNMSKLNMLTIVLYVICLIIFGSYTARTWLYYIRLKNGYKLDV
jgi:hypothetical protein